MKHNKEKHTTLSVDIGLFLYLQEKVCERKTKTEAYCNLLKKASGNGRFTSLQEQEQLQLYSSLQQTAILIKPFLPTSLMQKMNLQSKKPKAMRNNSPITDAPFTLRSAYVRYFRFAFALHTIPFQTGSQPSLIMFLALRHPPRYL